MQVDIEKTSLRGLLFACGSRLTSKTKDLARGLFPLFELQWPSPETSLEEGQVLLVKALTDLYPDAGILAELNGPVGLPKPWGWAPISLPSSSNIGVVYNEGRKVTADGLLGRWGWREVRVQSKTSGNWTTAPVKEPVASLTGNNRDEWIFETTDTQEQVIATGYYYGSAETFQRSDRQLFLLGSPKSDVNYGSLAKLDGKPWMIVHYNLAEVQGIKMAFIIYGGLDLFRPGRYYFIMMTMRLTSYSTKCLGGANDVGMLCQDSEKKSG